jgi:dTDP-4-amino-4,6-dideoxygalactose transaminase
MSGVEFEFLKGAFESNWITTLGPDVDAFEAELAAFVDAPVLALNSGSSALHLALLLAGVQPGDRVIVPTLTFAAPAFAVTYLGAEPVFVDSEERTWNIDVDLVEAELDSATPPAAVVAVDLYGQCAELDRLSAVCQAHGVPLIEDAAEALGADWQGRSAGTWGDLGVFSFNGNKIMTTGGGGVLVGSQEILGRARTLATQARLPVAHYEHEEIGYNYRLSNLLAAVGRGQLQRLPKMIERVRSVNQQYRDGLAGVDAITFMPWDDRGSPNGWLTVAQIDPAETEVTPQQVCDFLAGLEIEARPAWKPMHLQPVFAGCRAVDGSVAERLFDRGVCLPSGSTLSDGDVDRVIEGIHQAFASR